MTKSLFFDGATKLSCTHLGVLSGGQDGAICNGLLFRFHSKGNCWVYDLQTLQEVGTFTLDKTDLLIPHSNSVFFGNEYYRATDEFPVLYTNIYNNYAHETDRKEGVLCAYRITRDEQGFSSQLVQILQIGFTSDSRLWCSEGNTDIRPYGNFIMDTEARKLYAFVMRDKTHTTRFFRFSMPAVTDGDLDETLGVPVKILSEKNIEQQFDECYVNFMQGAACHKGILYSVEGFNYPSQRGNPAMRIFDVAKEKQIYFADLVSCGLEMEPELIEVYHDRLYYSDHTGHLFSFCFED